MTMLIEDFKQNFTKDLRNLLNTRRSLVADLNKKMEEKNVLLNYGIPVFSTLNPRSSSEREYLRKTIENSIEYFEPHLNHVQVELLPQKDSEKGLLKLHISAQTDHQNSIEFVSLFDPLVGYFSLEEI
jgi:type VI secretion system lysozyme-like protein